MTEGDRSFPEKATGALGWCGRNPHFMIAAAILLVCAAGWNVAQQQLQWVLAKEPVPWPAGVQVNEDFRCTSLAREFRDATGEVRYRMTEHDFDGDGVPDGEVTVRDEQLDLLGIGHSTDRKRLPNRRSNWYAIRIYEDTRTGRLWHLGVYYYTGMLDTVPHVPERCGQAAGMTPLGGKTVPLSVPPSAWEEDAPGVKWRDAVPWRRADFVNRTGGKVVEFYTFGLNAKPEADWKMVRLRLTAPWLKYCYFAKIQFSPLGEVADFDQANALAEDFAACALPEILKALPSAEAIEAARAAEETN